MSKSSKCLQAICSDLDGLVNTLVSTSSSPKLEFDKLKYEEMLRFFKGIRVRELEKHVDILTDLRDVLSRRHSDDDDIEALSAAVDTLEQLDELIISLQLMDYNK